MTNQNKAPFSAEMFKDRPEILRRALQDHAQTSSSRSSIFSMDTIDLSDSKDSIDLKDSKDSLVPKDLTDLKDQTYSLKPMNQTLPLSQSQPINLTKPIIPIEQTNQTEQPAHHQCTQCNRTLFGYRSDLHSHIVRVHAYGGARFQHIKTYHNLDEPEPEPQSQFQQSKQPKPIKIFPEIKKTNPHKKAPPKRPTLAFMCHRCGQSFTHKSSLKIHGQIRHVAQQKDTATRCRHYYCKL